MSEAKEWTVTFATQAEAAKALKQLRGGLGSRAREHWAVEFGKVAILIAAILLALAGAVSEVALFAFACGVLTMNYYFRFVKPRLLARFGPQEFGSSKDLRVRVSVDGLKLDSDNSQTLMKWSMVPLPRIQADGLVFRVAHEAAVPFPTRTLSTEPGEIAAAVRAWKEDSGA